MRPDEVPTHMEEAARVAMRQANTHGLEQQWAAALEVWLEVARQYPHESSPLVAMLNLFVGASEAQGTGYPRLAPSEQTSIQSAAARTELWEAVQRSLFARLEEMARSRGIQIRVRRGLRTGGYVRSLLLWVPWLGPRANGVYTHTFRPSRLPPPPRRSGTASRPQARWVARWAWPGRIIYLNQHLTHWAPDTLAHVLSQHMFVCHVLYERHADVRAASAELVGVPLSQRLSLLTRAIERGRELGPPAYAMLAPEGRTWAAHYRALLMLRVLRQELHQLGML